MIDEILLNKILDDIFSLTNPAIDKSRRPQISEFINSTINGDVPQENLVINCVLGKDRKGALVYILTNARLVKIEIDATNLSSSSPSLATIVNVDKKIGDGNKAQVTIDFQNDSFGLTYMADNPKINDFFQKVDLARVRGKS